MNRQQVVEDVAEALSQQQTKSMGPNGCRYRENMQPHDKIKCGIGHLIPDELYEQEMDNVSMNNQQLWMSGGYGASELVSKFPKLEAHLEAKYGPITERDRYFLSYIQGEMHDNLPSFGRTGLDWSKERLLAIGNEVIARCARDESTRTNSN